MASLKQYLQELRLLPKNTDILDIGIEPTSSIPWIKLAGPAGTVRYIFVDNNGDIRISATEPTANTSGNVAGGGVLVADVTITSAQVLALNATPQTMITAPGAGLAIVPLLTVAYKAAGVAYAGIAAGEDLALRYTDGSGTILTAVETTGFLDQTTAQTRIALTPQSAAGTGKVELTPTANAAVVAHLLSGEITTGDSDIKLKIYYRIVPTVL